MNHAGTNVVATLYVLSQENNNSFINGTVPHKQLIKNNNGDLTYTQTSALH